MRRLIRVAGVLLIIALLGGGLLAWRIARGPLELSFLTPYVERTLARDTITVRLGGLSLAWKSSERHVDLRLRDVDVIDASGASIATAPGVRIALRARALLRRALDVRRVEVLGARLRLVRAAAGGFDVAVGAGHDDAAGRLRAWLETGPGARLGHVTLHDGDVVFEDRIRGRTWHATGVEATLERKGQGVSVRGSGTAELGGSATAIRLETLYRADAANTVGVRFTVPDAASLAGEVGTAAASRLLSRMHLPLRGRLQVGLDGELRPRGGRIKVTGGAGTIVAPELRTGTLPVRGVRAGMRLDAASGRVAVDQLELVLAQTTLRVQGSMSDGRLHATATAAALPTDAIDALWPENHMTAARAWVTTRVAGGRARDVRLRVDGRMAEAGERFDVEAVDGALAFDDLTVRYLDGMPPAVGLAGTATVTDRGLTFRVARGAIGGLAVSAATVQLADLARPVRRGEVVASMRGALADAMTIVRTLPFAPAGVDAVPPGTEGAVAADVRVRFPLRPVRAAADVGLTVTARMTDVRARRVLRDWSFADGKLELHVHRGALDLAGTGTVEGAPLTIDWHQQTGSGARRRVDVRTRLDDASRAALGFDLRPSLAGLVDVRATFVEERDSAVLDASADLSTATLRLPVLGTSKDTGVAGRVDARVAFANGVVTSVERLSLRAGDTIVTGHATRARDAARWESIFAEASLAPRVAAQPRGHVKLVLQHGREFVVTSDDAGATIRALGTGAEAEGGRLHAAGTVDVDGAGVPSVAGRLEAHGVRILKAPLIARVAALASVTAVTDAFRKDGITFEVIGAQIEQRGTTLTISDGVASGSSITMLFAGTVDTIGRTVALRGTLVPAYFGMNAALGRVPVLGRLAGREGLHAFDFRITGSTDAPAVSVDPFSSLTPGVLRDVVRRWRGR